MGSFLPSSSKQVCGRYCCAASGDCCGLHCPCEEDEDCQEDGEGPRGQGKTCKEANDWKQMATVLLLLLLLLLMLWLPLLVVVVDGR